uniref:Estradiol 17-beta-dehydrogenase 11 n=1 Tax=Coturnix japonica TaxID=93934 RepID=A0A8C2TET9_COTJA
MNLAVELLLFVGTLLYSYVEALLKLLLPVKRKNVRGELVLVTGAARGLGRATAREFARCQSRLVLWDVEAHGLKETAAECESLGATVHTFVVDCSKREEIYSAADKVKKDIGDVSILVNNAGVIAAADLLSTQDHQVEKTFEVNILAHIWTTRAFLPTMMKNNHGHIVTVASAAGHFVVPFMVTYCASKFAAVGFHKALTDELSSLGKDGIKTTCLCPVFINTGFVKNPSTRHHSPTPPLPASSPRMRAARPLLPAALGGAQVSGGGVGPLFIPPSLTASTPTPLSLRFTR